MEIKKCSKCGEEKSLEEFHKDKNTKDGKCFYCNKCSNKSHKDHRLKFPERHILAKAKYRAKKFGIPFNLTIEDIVIPEICPVFKKPFVYGNKKHMPFSPSLDKIIPEKGYIKGNVAVISHRANSIKSDASIEELKSLVLFLENL